VATERARGGACCSLIFTSDDPLLTAFDVIRPFCAWPIVPVGFATLFMAEALSSHAASSYVI